MIWLVTHIWLFIGLAALFGLVLGWALRGIRVSGGARRAVVERNIALTELDQVRTELDSLYTAQRVQGSDGQIQVELQQRDAKLVELQEALTVAREELVTSRAESEKKLLAAAAATAAVVGTGAVIASDKQNGQEVPERLDREVNSGQAQIEWRNRYLESRVRSLESTISDVETAVQAEPEMPVIEDMSEQVAELESGNRALQDQIETLERELDDERRRDNGVVTGVTGAVAGAGAAVIGQDLLADKEAVADTTYDTVERDKLAWQNEYLRQRLTFMEANGISTAADTPSVTPMVEVPDASVQEPEAETGAALAEPQIESAAPGDIEQELARLRWRNRYLEGRLAYIDGGASTEEASASESIEETGQKSAAEALLERLERSDGADT